MAINEVFINPTVKTVAFEIRFPNLFFLEQRIGDLQNNIMSRFPESDLVYQRQLLLADLGPDAKLEELEEKLKPDSTQKIWRFRSRAGVTVNVRTHLLGIESTQHKSYNSPDGDHGFRETVEFVVSAFLKVAPIPVMTRLGLRYIDECPIPDNVDNDTFREWYDTSLPLHRFVLADASDMIFRATVAKGAYRLRYTEAFKLAEGKPSLVLDFDAFAAPVDADKYLDVCDALHDIVHQEFENSIKGPVIEYMRKAPEEKE